MNQIKNRFTGKIIAEGEESINSLVVKNRANLSRADLSRADLCGANLSWADLCGANLFRADLSRADLCGANLCRANLCRANLCGANLCGANLSWADLSRADLSRADLSRTDLSRTDLCGANIEFHQFPSIRTLSSMPLRNISNKIILELMRLDADAYPKPELFDIWAQGGDCPYKNEERWWWMSEKREIWKPGKPTMKLSDLILEICRQEGWEIRGYLPNKETS
uniref:Pentapeptide repeat-containing protein n=2 Tax=viral metagenome TaxID=1070528 RepID=A0A6M3Y5F9_9ZZZZ